MRIEIVAVIESFFDPFPVFGSGQSKKKKKIGRKISCPSCQFELGRVLSSGHKLSRRHRTIIIAPATYHHRSESVSIYHHQSVSIYHHRSISIYYHRYDRGKGVPSFDEMVDFALVEVDFDDPTTNVRGRRALAIAKPTPRGY